MELVHCGASRRLENHNQNYTTLVNQHFPQHSYSHPTGPLSPPSLIHGPASWAPHLNPCRVLSRLLSTSDSCLTPNRWSHHLPNLAEAHWSISNGPPAHRSGPHIQHNQHGGVCIVRVQTSSCGPLTSIGEPAKFCGTHFSIVAGCPTSHLRLWWGLPWPWIIGLLLPRVPKISG